MNVSIPPLVTGFADFIVPEDMLKGPYSILLDNDTPDFSQANVTGKSFQYLTFLRESIPSA